GEGWGGGGGVASVLLKCADVGMDGRDLERRMRSDRQRRDEEGLARRLERRNATGEEVEQCAVGRAEPELLRLRREVAHIEEPLNTVAREKQPEVGPATALTLSDDHLRPVAGLAQDRRQAQEVVQVTHAHHVPFDAWVGRTQGREEASRGRRRIRKKVLEVHAVFFEAVEERSDP